MRDTAGATSAISFSNPAGTLSGPCCFVRLKD